MARSNSSRSYVSGKSTQQLLSMSSTEFSSLSASELRQVVRRLADTANKRLQSFDRAGELSPAVRAAQQSGGRFSTAGKDINALRAEFVRERQFLESKTGTRSGWEKVQTATTKALKDRGVDVTPAQFDQLWQSYEKLKEMSPEVENKKLKYRVLRDIADMMDDESMSAEDIAEELQSKLDLIYEQQEEMSNEGGGVSDFFDLDDDEDE